MDFESKNPCGHFQWEADLGGDARGCRYCNYEMFPGASQYPLGERKVNMFSPKPNALRGHAMWGSGLGYAPRFGAGRLGIYVMAESLGKDEERQSRPLVGPTGKLMARMFYRTPDPEGGEPLDLDRDAVRGNIVPIKPPFDKLDNLPWPLRADLYDRCRPLWQADLRAAQPKVILAAGDVALRALTGMHGVTKVRGAIHRDTPYGPVVATYHPAYLMRGKMHLAQVWQTDLRRALYIARHGVPKIERNYLLYPSGLDMESQYKEWVAAGRPPLAFDIETPYAGALKDEESVVDISDMPTNNDPSYKIDRVSWSWEVKRAGTAPYCEPHRTWFHRMLREATVSMGWNSDDFDIPRLVNDGARIGGLHIDLMKLWHFLEPGLPMGLKNTSSMFFFDVDPQWTTRALGKSDPVLYSAIDSDFTMRLGEMLVARAKANGTWGVFERHFVQLGVVLRAMSKIGVKTDQKVRAKAHRGFSKVLAGVKTKMQEHVPQSVLPRKIYKKDEASLRKSGAWVEGKMVEVKRMEPRPLEVIYFYSLKDFKIAIREKIKAASAAAAAEAHKHEGCECEVSVGKPVAPKRRVFIITYVKEFKKKPPQTLTRRVLGHTLEIAMSKVKGAVSGEEA